MLDLRGEINKTRRAIKLTAKLFTATESWSDWWHEERSSTPWLGRDDPECWLKTDPSISDVDITVSMTQTTLTSPVVVTVLHHSRIPTLHSAPLTGAGCEAARISIKYSYWILPCLSQPEFWSDSYIGTETEAWLPVPFLLCDFWFIRFIRLK